jgi:hypothetical protein
VQPGEGPSELAAIEQEMTWSERLALRFGSNPVMQRMTVLQQRVAESNAAKRAQQLREDVRVRARLFFVCLFFVCPVSLFRVPSFFFIFFLRVRLCEFVESGCGCSESVCASGSLLLLQRNRIVAEACRRHAEEVSLQSKFRANSAEL